MFKLTSKKFKIFGPKEMLELLVINTYEGQRVIRKTNLTNLKEKIKEGKFRTGEIAIATMLFNGGERVLMNGQTQAQAVIETGIPISAMLEEFECDRPIDVAELFGTFDTHGFRSRDNLARAEKIALGITWPDKLVSLIISVGIHTDGLKNSHNTQKIKVLSKYKNFGKFLFDYYSEGTGKFTVDKVRFLFRQPVAYPIFLTWSVDKGDAEKFWSNVRDGDKLEKDSPVKKLRDYLMTTTAQFGYRPSTPKNYRKEGSFHEIVSKSVTAWNAFRRGERTDLKYYQGRPIPEII